MPSASRSRIVLDVRQSLPAWKQSVFLFASLAVGLAISVAILWAAGISPLELAGELAGVFNSDSLRAVLVQAAPLMLVGLGASLAFRIGFWNLGLEGQMVFGGIFAADADPLGGVSELHCIEPVDPHLSSPIVGVV